MARPNIETSAAPAVQGTIEDHIQLLAALLIAVSVIGVALLPGAIIGAAGMGLWRWRKRPLLSQRVALIVVPLVCLIALHSLLQPGWLLREISPGLPLLKGVRPAFPWSSIPVEVLAGPACVEALLFALFLRRRTLGGQIRTDHRRNNAQWRAISGKSGLTSNLSAMLSDPVSIEHPAGFIRLGTDGESNKPFDLKLPDELGMHIFLPGTNGSGKTTTLTRLADGALANWYGLIIIDCKAGDLGDTARDLAGRYGLPFYLVDPAAPDSLGYDISTGIGPDVANKLVGAFTFSANAEIYKNIAMEALPLVVDGLLAAPHEEISLQRLYDAFGPRGYAIIAQQLDEDDRLRVRLLNLASGDSDPLNRGGRAGLQRRIGALLEGRFGPLFRHDHMLDWDQALAQPSVVYIALSTLASSEDVELMGRVIAQDLKQVCARRLIALRNNQNIHPVLAVFDEFAALREAEQLTDLLLQARQALMPTVISTQYVPESVPLSKAVLGAGLTICHRCADDAETIANQFGTRKTTELTNQMDFTTGFSDKGTFKRVDTYNVSPNILRTLQKGYAVVKSVERNGHAVIHVHRDA